MLLVLQLRGFKLKQDLNYECKNNDKKKTLPRFSVFLHLKKVQIFFFPKVICNIELCQKYNWIRGKVIMRCPHYLLMLGFFIMIRRKISMFYLSMCSKTDSHLSQSKILYPENIDTSSIPWCAKLFCILFGLDTICHFCSIVSKFRMSTT